MREPVVSMVNVSQRFAVLTTGEVLQLTNLLDDEGEETDNLDDAVSVVAPMADGRWIAINLRALEKVAPN